MNHHYELDVAFSLAGEQRNYVRKVFNYVEDRGIKVFFYESRKAELWGKNQVDYFQQVFQNNAKFCVMFISKEYKEKIWTNYERQVIQARSLVDNGYVLPVRFDDTEIEGLLSTVSYISANDFTPEQLGELIIEKVRGREKQDISIPQITFRQPKVKKSFNPYEEAKEWISFLVDELRNRCELTSTVDLSFSDFERNGTKCIRLVQNGETVYSLNITMGGISGDKGLSFYGVSGEISSGSGSSNAWGNFEWDKQSDMVLLEFHDMSMLDHFPSDANKYNREDFLEAVWYKIIKVIEGE